MKIYGKEPEDFIQRLFDLDQDPTRRMMERVWFRNILYEIGEQYVEFLTSTQSFRRKQVRPFTPTPVSNIIRDYVKAMSALILNKDYKIKVWPNSESMEDKDAAELAEKIMRDMDLSNDSEFFEEAEKCVNWMIVCGTAFLRVFPMMDRGEFGYDKKGNLIKTGDVATEALLPFNVFVDLLGDNIRDKRYVGIKSIKSREWVEDTFNVKLNSEDLLKEMPYQRQLMKMVSDVSPWKGYGLNTANFTYDCEDFVVFKEVEFKPTTKYPEGRYIVSAGGQILLDVKRMPIPVQDNDWFYSLTDFHYNLVPGRYWSDGGVNDLISPQNAINQIDQALEMARKGLSRPILSLPHGTSLKRKHTSGQAFITMEYDPRTSGGQAPKVSPGTPLPNQFLDERSIHKGVAQDAAGDPKNILRGQLPAAGSSGYLVDVLRETAEQSHEPDLQRYFRGMTRVYRKRLVLAKELYTEKRLLKINEGDKLQIISFTSADLRNNTDIRLEVSSDIAATKTGQTQLAIQLANAGFFGDLNELPEVRNDLLKRIGIGGMAEDINTDLERALRENNKIKNDMIDGIFIAMPNEETGEPVVMNQDPNFKFDNHQLHYNVHRKFMLSNEFNNIPEKAQVVLRAHMELHERALFEEKQKQIQAREQLMSQMQQQPQRQQPRRGQPEVDVPDLV